MMAGAAALLLLGSWVLSLFALSCCWAASPRPSQVPLRYAPDLDGQGYILDLEDE
jgi:hypothetical protein